MHGKLKLMTTLLLTSVTFKLSNNSVLVLWLKF